MQYETEFIYRPQYEWTSSNQHGNRFKKIGTKQIRVAKLSAKRTDANDLTNLVLLSDRLRVPIYYDFDADPQVACIKIVAKDALKDS